MTDHERILRNQVTDLEERLHIMEKKYNELAANVQLSDREREILAGRNDGQIPIGMARPIFRRVFGI